MYPLAFRHPTRQASLLVAVRLDQRPELVDMSLSAARCRPAAPRDQMGDGHRHPRHVQWLAQDCHCTGRSREGIQGRIIGAGQKHRSDTKRIVQSLDELAPASSGQSVVDQGDIWPRLYAPPVSRLRISGLQHLEPVATQNHHQRGPDQWVILHNENHRGGCIHG